MKRAGLTLLLGAAGGLLGFVLSEVLAPEVAEPTFVSHLWTTALFTALFTLPLTLTLTAADNVVGLRGRWSRGLSRTLVPAVLVGAVSGALAQFGYALALPMDYPPRLVRAVAWAVMGAGVGLIPGLNDRSWPKAWRGALGGSLGGGLGGLMFDSFGVLSLGPQDDGILARAVGLTVLGAAIGALFRLSQDLLKTDWLTVLSGAAEGRQYILTQGRVTVGRSDANDVALYKDAALPLKAGTLTREGGGWRWEGEAGEVNGTPQTRALLQTGDVLRVGSTPLRLESRRTRPGDAPAPSGHQLLLEGPGGLTLLPPGQAQLTVGRRGQVRVQGRGVVPVHAELRLTEGRVEVLARARTSVNGQPLPRGSRGHLRVGDELQLGEAAFRLVRGTLVAPAAPAPAPLK